MADDEESFDIYGDDDDSSTSPSSPSHSGPKKRLRRERSSSAPPMMSPKDEDDDGASTPRQKKMKEDEGKSDTTVVDDDQDPFREYENHVCLSCTCTFSAPLRLFAVERISCYRLHVWETNLNSIVILRLLLLLLNCPQGFLPLKGRSRRFRFLLLLPINLLRLYMSLNFIGGPAMKISVVGPAKLVSKTISKTLPSPSIK
jgi:hypothetical protein